METEFVFIKIEMNNVLSILFPFKTLIPLSFTFFEVPMKLHIFYCPPNSQILA